MKIELHIPPEVSRITATLENAGFQAFLVGGCVRDLLIGNIPKDWDIATDAVPNEIAGLFPKTVYENNYGTVTAVNGGVEDLSLRNMEITPFRLESDYSDKRHPDEVKFSKNIEDDLKRRDFTINALAYDPKTGELIDLYGGIQDLKDGVIKTVREPDRRFGEDALRILRAVRFATQLGFTINPETEESIVKNAELLKAISRERIREEFTKIIMSDKPMFGLNLSHKLGILQYILPELEEGIGIEQNGDHIYPVWDHILRVAQYTADKKWPLHIRLAAILHDIAKPRTRRWSDENKDWTFYGHEAVGERMADQILKRLKYPNKIIDAGKKLVKSHMFFSDTDKITLSAVRRIIVKVGQDLIWDLMKVREADRIGMGRPKANPYRLRKYESMIEEALRQPTSVMMLKMDGKKLMKVTGEPAGPRIGFILHALLEEVLEDANLNTEEHLTTEAKELAKLNDQELMKKGEGGKEKKEEKEQEEISKIRKKHFVQ